MGECGREEGGMEGVRSVKTTDSETKNKEHDCISEQKVRAEKRQIKNRTPKRDNAENAK